MRVDSPVRQDAAKGRAATTFLLAACWIAVALFTSRTSMHILPSANGAILHAALDALLLFAGLYWIAFRTISQARPLSSVGFVRRPTQWLELGAGVAIGWGVAVLMVLPAVLTLRLRSSVIFDGFHAVQMLLGLVLLVLTAIVTQMIFYGLAFRSLVTASSPAIAVLATASVAAVLVLLAHTGDLAQAVFAGFASLLFSLGALRTRAVWLPLGLQLGWSVAVTLLFGVSSFYWPTVNGPVQSLAGGARWFTGNGLGPEASLPAFLFVAFGLILVWRATRDYAWHYAFDPIVGAAHPMDVPPPAEHTRMEEQARDQPVNLVQIQGTGVADPPADRGAGVFRPQRESGSQTGTERVFDER